MIYLDRSRSQAPGQLISVLEKYREEALEFFSLPDSKRSQARFTFMDIDKIPELKAAIVEEFHGKCAYTEAPIDAKSCRIIRHRPRNGASNLDYSSDRDHYWWLAYEWRNLVPVQRQSARAKGHYFPVEGKRAAPESPLSVTIKKERALLPDPSLPNPSKHLVFGTDGRVTTTPEFGPVLEILALNNANLVRQRKSAFLDFQRNSRGLHSKQIKDFLETHLTLDCPFLEARIQWLESFLEQNSRSKKPCLEILRSLGENYPVQRIATLIQSLRSPQGHSRVSGSKSSGTPSEESEAPSILHSVQIEKIEIVNFKCIERLVIDLKQKPDQQSPNGLMILGENGSGKSSILQAIALALEDPARLDDHPFLTHKKVLRREATKGHVKLFLTGQRDPVEVGFSRIKFSFHGPRDQLHFFLSAYGPHRIMPRYNDDSAEIQISAPISIKNLWDPYESLVDAERWMLSLDKKQFDSFALALKDLLDLREDGLIYRKRGSLLFDIGGKQQSLDDLSAGYRSIIATATDIIASYPVKGIDMQQATGIIMIDEIGAHLHPRWRMRIVNAYRRTFKGLQFLCTTHEPLCLRGTRQEELVVLARAGETVQQITDLPDLEELRIDQILTSPVFGMQTTVDPEAERNFQEYYYLLAKKKQTTKEKKRTEELKKKLYRYGVLGTDRRSRAIYDLIDTELATQTPNTTSPAISATTRRKFRELWDNTDLEL